MIDPNNSVTEFLNEINNKVKLSDFISQYVQLTERGNSFVGKCPFHNENTPSFNVNNEKALFYCFGCKTGGNIINFITKHNNLSFKEAIDHLSKYSGIRFLLNSNKTSENSEETILNNILMESNRFFQNYLRKNRAAYEYIRSREVSDKVIECFNIGYCPDERILVKFLESKGFKIEQIKKTDLLIKNKNNQYFGRFRNRITFPIFNFTNKIVGFGGRSIQNSKIKYINSQENPIFKKSQILFGLLQNLEHIRSKKEIILVEGYMDVIKLHESDIKYAVSSLGTTLSEAQTKKMWNFSDIPYICFDGDEAGADSAKKIATKILKFLVPGKSVKFILVPDKNDPDSFMKENTKEDFEKLKEESRDLSDVIWDIIIESVETHTPEFLASIDEKIKNLTHRIDDRKISKEYYKFLSSKKDQFIWNKNRINVNRKTTFQADKITENLNEKIFVLLILMEESFLAEFQEEISSVKLSDNNLNIEKEKIIEFFSEGNYKKSISMDNLKNTNMPLYSEINDLKRTHINNLGNEEKKLFFKQILNNLRLPILIDERKLVKKEILMSQDNKISEGLLRKYNKLSDEIKIIRNKGLE